MLIQCPECQNNISDKAIQCIHCGYPIKNTLSANNAVYEQKKRTKRNFARLPKGYGTIREYKGNRRKPFGAFLPVTEYKDNGTPVQPKAIGYYATRTEAMEALTEYHKYSSPDSICNLTFSECYEKYYYEKYEGNKHKTYSKDAKRLCKLAYKYSHSLYKHKIKNITPSMLQEALDSSVSYNVAKNQIVLYHCMFKFAFNKDWIIRDPSVNIVNNHTSTTEETPPFTEEEIQKFWDNSADRDVRFILIMLYTGMRITEYTDVIIDGDYILGGIKTENGRDRIVPIHPAIKEFIPDMMNDYINGIGANSIRKRYYKTLERLDISTEHNPHTTRHTFSWLCDKYKMDDVSKRLIMGHSLGKDVEINTYGHRTKEELMEEIKKIEI